jgi:hypothetical protein
MTTTQNINVRSMDRAIWARVQVAARRLGLTTAQYLALLQMQAERKGKV